MITLATTTVSVLLGLERPPAHWPPPGALGITLTCIGNLSTVARRRAPLTVMLFCCALWAWYITLGYWPMVNSLAPMLAIYTVAAQRPSRYAALAAAVMGGTWIYAGLRTQDSAMASVVAQALAWPTVLWKFGDSARKLAINNERLAETAERLRLEQEDRARRAVADERTRIARELHDVVAHHLSVIAVQAGLARYVLESDPGTAARALDTVLDTGSEALDELRRVLALLRANSEDPDEGEPYTPASGLGQLTALAERVTAAGVSVRVETTGDPHPLPPGVDLCAFRIVQESLTNTLKHAPGSRATVAVRYGGDDLTVRVTDDGAGSTPGPGTGNGLLGMRERAQLYGGLLRAGPRPEGGFEVLLTLPSGDATIRHPEQ
ncbi:sensor histidine kinase [Streptomyces sp. NPDC020096]